MTYLIPDQFADDLDAYLSLKEVRIAQMLATLADALPDREPEGDDES